MDNAESKLFKFGFQEFQNHFLNDQYTIKVDLSNVINVGGCAIIFEIPNGNCLKIEKLKISDASNWNKNRGKYNGSEARLEYDLNFGEEILVNGFEFGTIKRIINEIKNNGLIIKALRSIVTALIHIHQADASFWKKFKCKVQM